MLLILTLSVIIVKDKNVTYSKEGTYTKGAMRTWKHIAEENERWLEETAGDRTKLKMYYYCEYKPIFQSKLENQELMKTFTPDPLHCNLLGPGNDCLDKIEELGKDIMFSFYKRHAMSKSGLVW